MRELADRGPLAYNMKSMLLFQAVKIKKSNLPAFVPSVV